MVKIRLKDGTTSWDSMSPEWMATLAGSYEGSARTMQDLLDAVPADRIVSCLATHEALILHDGEKELGRIPIDSVVDVLVIDDTTVQRRPTMGLLMFLGPLAFLFMKTTVKEAYRVSIQWKGGDDEGYNFTYIRMATRPLADRMLNSIKHALTPEARIALAQKATEAKKPDTVTDKAQSNRTVETSQFVTCGHCTMEYRKSDLPPGGKCPVCGRPLNLSFH